MSTASGRKILTSCVESYTFGDSGPGLKYFIASARAYTFDGCRAAEQRGPTDPETASVRPSVSREQAEGLFFFA